MVLLTELDERKRQGIKKYFKSMSEKGASKGGHARMAKHHANSPNRGASLQEHTATVLQQAYRLSPKHVGRMSTYQHDLSSYYKNDRYRTM